MLYTPQTATVAHQANILNLEIISCYVGDVKKLFELVQKIND